MATKKKGNHQNGPGACKGADCEWQNTVQGGTPVMSCENGNGGCGIAELLDADESDFHDQSLIEATRKIKRILAGIPKDSRGRKLSFCQTNMGTLLAWVQHGGKASGRRVTARDSDAKVTKALKLKV
jgi:hypothetical protein